MTAGARSRKHRVTVNDRRRKNKNDLLRKSRASGELKRTFDMYYRGPLRTLYNAVFRQR